MASSASSTTVASTTLNSVRDHEYFETGVNHVLCKVPGLDQPSFPTEYQNTWDLEHVRMPCSKRIYESDKSFWPEIVKSLSEPIVNCQQLSDVMLQWNKGKQNGWNMNALDAFLNNRSADLPLEESGAHSDTLLDPTEQQIQAARAAQSSSDEDDYDFGWSPPHQEGAYGEEQVHPFQQPGEDAGTGIEEGRGGPLKSQFLSTEERQYFFDVTLPRMQALALRLPELITKPIPFLKQQQDSAVTLSQEQIACLLANAFFNTFPCRNVPYKRGRKKKSAVNKGDSTASNVKQGGKSAADEEDESESDDEDERPPSKGNRQANNKGGGARGGGSGGGVRGGGRGGKKGQGIPRPPRKQRSQGPAAQFEFFEDKSPSSLSTHLENLAVRDGEVKVVKDWMPKMPSFNFISLFWTEESRTPCTPTQAAKLRCILHYFDRVTTEMPRGTVTYHRQVLKKPAYLAANERWRKEDFTLSNVTLDWSTPLEEAPQGALQLDFANKNIGGGALEKGAVQEEIRFMICPELIVSRLFCQQLEANEAVLIKGVERYSNHIGYSKTFEWLSDHQDPTPRDKLGRRMTEVCAIDARPFKSRASRLDQFERHYVLREINKAIVGFRQSPINASEWGLARPDDDDSSSSSAERKRFRPIATGNWGCGAFGGHLQLKFVLQWIAASICGGFSPEDKSLGDDLLYYTFGMQQLQEEIEAFVRVANASRDVIDPKRLVECITRYPRRNPAGEIHSFREKTLLEYLSTAMTFVPEA
ncbi:hypothetical protein KI688_002981 [Linnemannia hyalina]|uniref:poly(ADP-ribose) glycohydrolase n=1 Tax=Linnemannia hyalina TaxID=64524 RepID=A0A9P8BT88_9FUNG|nr:hypothetical protein KI688_002981 [Linnemannia hyalina]